MVDSNLLKKAKQLLTTPLKLKVEENEVSTMLISPTTMPPVSTFSSIFKLQHNEIYALDPSYLAYKKLPEKYTMPQMKCITSAYSFRLLKASLAIVQRLLYDDKTVVVLQDDSLHVLNGYDNEKQTFMGEKDVPYRDLFLTRVYFYIAI